MQPRTAIVTERWYGRASWGRSKTHAFSDLDCGHTIDHGPSLQVRRRPLPLKGDRVTCRRCTADARAKARREAH